MEVKVSCCSKTLPGHFRLAVVILQVEKGYKLHICYHIFILYAKSQ